MLKKVLDENPLRKLLIVYALLVMVISYAIRSIESVNAACYWKDGGGAADRTSSAEDLVCSTFGWDKALWLVMITYANTWYAAVLTLLL